MDQLRQKKGFICDMDGVGDIPGPAEQQKISNPLPAKNGSGLLIVISLRA